MPADKAAKLYDLVMQLRQHVVNQPGYISGESLKSIDKPDVYLVISAWNGIDEWKAWLASEERAEIQNQIDTLLGKKTEYDIYEYRG